MSILNPLSLISQIQQGNPRQVAQMLFDQKFKNDPIMQNVLQMGLNNDTQGLEQFARQLLSQQGRDFDTELNNLRNLTRG